jgi:hypothetical protein
LKLTRLTTNTRPHPKNVKLLEEGYLAKCC